MRIAFPLASALVFCVTALAAAPLAGADTIETFALDGNDSQSLDGDTLTVTLAGLEIGDVSFDAVLSVVGSSDLNQASSGLGIDGGSNPINDGESLRFSLTIENESGGSIGFDGFAGLDFTFFGTDGEQAVLSTDGLLSTTSDNFATFEGSDDDPADLSGTLPLGFTLFGNDDGGTVSFRVDSIDAQFSELAPVPEPSTLSLLGGALLLCGIGRVRRTRRRSLQAQSERRAVLTASDRASGPRPSRGCRGRRRGCCTGRAT